MERKIAMVATQVNLEQTTQSIEDIKYWLSKTPQECIAAVTFLINQNLKPGEKMDRSKSSQINLKCK